MKKILILGGIFLHVKLVKEAHKQGYKTIVVDNVINSPAKLISDYFYDVNVTDIDTIVEICKKEGVSAVITGYIDFCQRYYQEICDKLKVPCYGTYEQFQVLTNKERFKKVCVENNVDVIPSYSEEEIISDSSKVQYPVYVKPSYSRGSRGQFVCFSKKECINAIREASEISNDDKAIIEKYLGNNDNFQVTYFVVDGRPYLLRTADQYQGNKANGLEKLCLAAVSPSRYTDFYIKNVNEKVVKMIMKLGIKNGPVFMQGFIDGDTVRFYDPGLRFPGTDYSVVLKKITGIDTAEALIEFATTGQCRSILKHLNNESVYLNNKFIINLFPTIQSGKITYITDKNKLLCIDGVENLSYRHEVGDVIEQSGNVNQRISEINISVSSETELAEVLNRIYDDLVVLNENGENMINNKFFAKNISFKQI